MSATNTFENSLLAHALGIAPLTMPSANYLALLTSDPGEAGDTATEVAGLAYARQPVTFTAPVSGQSSNAAIVNFPFASGGSWGTITHWAIMSSAMGGEMRIKGALATPRTIADGDQLVIQTAALAVSLD